MDLEMADPLPPKPFEDLEMEEEDDDPILSTYNIFIKPPLSTSSGNPEKQIYILQFPNRMDSQNYTLQNNALPLKLRIKPEAKMVELDVPMDAHANYDREKGLKWGEAIKKSSMTKGGGSHGLPGGFGIGGAQPGRGRGRAEQEQDEESLQQLLNDEGFKRAVAQEKVLVKQTLGGQAVPDDTGAPLYMIGTFRDDQLHLTPVDNIVQMRPQFHHIDASAEQDRFSRGRDPALAASTQNARAIHMTVKSGLEEDETSNEKPMNERISAAQSEQWKSHRVIDEADELAWKEYADSMFAGVATRTEVDEEENTNDLVARLPRLESALNGLEYLDEISGPRDPVKLARSMKKENEGEGGARSEDDSDE